LFSVADEALRIAMWSGPRNISTAMMRSWGARPDTFVCDEPLYAHYLAKKPEVAHPGRDEVIAHHETDWRKVVTWITGPVPEGRPIFYQKHMAHHLLDDIERDWLDQLTHCFLIRDPREMLTSLLLKYRDAGLTDTGLPQQIEIFNFVREKTGRTPPVLDSRDVLEDPRRILGLLCDALGVEFNEAMLSWPPGRRETDGVWARYWYDAVEKTTEFQPYRPKSDQVPPEHRGILDASLEHYHKLHDARLI
jgi:hypothetical protein